MKKILIIILLQILCLPMIMFAEAQINNNTKLQQSLDLWINNELSSDQMFTALKNIEEDLDKKRDNWEVKYLRARISNLKAQIYIEQNEKKLSIEELENSIKFAEASIELNEQSDTWRTMAEANSLLMLQKGLFFIIANFSTTLKQANRALELDPENARATLIAAQFLCNAPGIAGGDKEEGLSLLLNLLDRDDLGKSDRFFISRSLSDILFKEKRYDEAMIYCQKALRLYPGNRECITLKSNIQAKL